MTTNNNDASLEAFTKTVNVEFDLDFKSREFKDVMAKAKEETIIDLMPHIEKYLSLGLSVLPLHKPINNGERTSCSCGKVDCPSIGKHPYQRLVQHGLKNSSKDKTIVQDWFKDNNLNIGIATGTVSGIFALDIDLRHEGDVSLAKLEKEHGPLPKTWRFLTGGGGEHILFRYPKIKITNSTGTRLGAGIDIRGDGGFIVAPPSLHASGRRYVISTDYHPDNVPLANAPEWLFRKLAETSNNLSPKLDWKTLEGQVIPEGQRNKTIMQISGVLAGKHVHPHLALELALGFNQRNCNPRLKEEEVAKTVASIFKCEMRKNIQTKGDMYV